MRKNYIVRAKKRSAISMVKKQVLKSIARTKDIIKLMKGVITDAEYANKYNMTIEQVKNFKRLYSMLDKIEKKFRGTNLSI
jgi:hypothetical protein